MKRILFQTTFALSILFGVSCTSDSENVYNADGSLQAEYETKDGVRHGTGKFYGTKNYLASTETWVNGKCEGITWVFNKDGDTIFKAYNHDGKVYGKTWLYSVNKKIKTVGDMWEGKMTGWVNTYDTVSGQLSYKKLIYNGQAYKEVIDVPTNSSDFYFDISLPDTVSANATLQVKIRLYNINEKQKSVHFKSSEHEIDMNDNANHTWTILSGTETTVPIKTGSQGYNRLLGVIQVDELMGDTLLHFKYPVADVYFAK